MKKSSMMPETTSWRFTCCIAIFTLCSVFIVVFFNPAYLFGPFLAASPSLVADQKILRSTQQINSRPPNPSFGMEEDGGPRLAIHNLSSSASHVYKLKGDVRIQGNSSTILIASSSSSMSARWITKPYARLYDKTAMQSVREFRIQVISNHGALPCTRNFSLPAIVFSIDGYSGNIYHDFSEVLIPLYLTSRGFNARVLFLIANRKGFTRWTSKYRLILNELSAYGLVDISNSTTNNEVVCFPQAIVGLTWQKKFGIDPSKPPHFTFQNFTHFLRTTYSLPRHIVHHHHRANSNPRLLILSRKRNRRLMNAEQVAEAGWGLGFDVMVTDLGPQLKHVTALVNSVDVMVGVHGAGLTNMVFLPANAVLIQIVPVRVGWAARGYQLAAEDMGLRYMEYNVGLNESSLTEKQLEGVHNQTHVPYKVFHAVYMSAQDVKVDVDRFKETVLSKALDHVLSAR